MTARVKRSGYVLISHNYRLWLFVVSCCEGVGTIVVDVGLSHLLIKSSTPPLFSIISISLPPLCPRRLL